MGSLIKYSKGFTLVEVLVSITLILLISVGGLAANSLATNAVQTNQMRDKANFLAREGMEAVQSVRAANFPSLHPGDFHPVYGVNGWTLSSGSETIGDFTRTITISSVERELTCTETVCAIVPAGGIVDSSTMKVQVKVSWKERGSDKSYSLDTYVTYWR